VFWYLELGIWNLVFGPWYLELGIWNLEFGPWIFEFGPFTLARRASTSVKKKK
jgi:hypothetical protein